MSKSIAVSIPSSVWFSIKDGTTKDLGVPCTLTDERNFVFVYVKEWVCFAGVLWVGKTVEGKVPIYTMVWDRVEMYDIPEDLRFIPKRYINLETPKNIPLHNFLHKHLAGVRWQVLIIQKEV